MMRDGYMIERYARLAYLSGGEGKTRGLYRAGVT